MTVAVWALPGARVSALAGVADGRLRVRIAAPAHEGKANAELLRYLASVLGVPRSAAAVTKGLGSRRKTVHVRGVAPDEARTKLHI